MTSADAPFLATAQRIGRQLCRDAIWAGDECGWLGWAMEFRAGRWAPAWRAIGPQLYDGTAGIGLFLGRLWSFTGESLLGDTIVRDTARGALAQALSAVDKLEAAGEYGLYSGLLGIARTCIDAAPLLGDKALAERGMNTLLRAARIAPTPQRLDVINGSAGVIPALIAAAVGAHRDELLASALAHADQLLALAVRSDQGWSWDTLSTGGARNLTGYSHGTAGIACAFAELWREVGRQDLRDAAAEALRYERSHFLAVQRNWPDFRDFDGARTEGPPPCMVAWCHGAPGIGMARLRMAEVLTDDSEIAGEIETAITTTAASLGQSMMDGGGNFSLCHGDAGNADLLILGADRLGRPELRRTVEDLGRRSIALFDEQDLPYPCGVLGVGETPNLMLGLAGIGYFFLRLHDSAIVPTILTVTT